MEIIAMEMLRKIAQNTNQLICHFPSFLSNETMLIWILKMFEFLTNKFFKWRAFDHIVWLFKKQLKEKQQKGNAPK